MLGRWVVWCGLVEEVGTRGAVLVVAWRGVVLGGGGVCGGVC